MKVKGINDQINTFFNVFFHITIWIGYKHYSDSISLSIIIFKTAETNTISFRVGYNQHIRSGKLEGAVPVPP